MDTGTGYGLLEGTFHEELTRVGPGTPCGEFMRRYWQPVALADDATATPRLVKALGEELVLSRDRSGRAGLLLPRCVHRGASLLYGASEEHGLRCCYHGWVFDAEGHCLEQPCEPMGGLYRDQVRQPWYPLVEYHGLLFTYMGPPDRKPAFPTYDVYEEPLVDEELIVPDDTSIGGGGPVILDFNWLQHWENVMDPFHVPILHARFSGLQFVEDMAVVPEVTYSYVERGVRSVQIRPLTDGRTLKRITEVHFPSMRLVPSPRLVEGRTAALSWVLPLDDTSFRIYTIIRAKNHEALRHMRATYGPESKEWWDLTDAEHREYPGDYESQRSQGSFQLHSMESLSTTDQGVTMLRRSLRRQIDLVAAGGDPAGVTFDAESARVAVEGGNFFLDAPIAARS